MNRNYGIVIGLALGFVIALLGILAYVAIGNRERLDTIRDTMPEAVAEGVRQALSNYEVTVAE